VDAKEYFIKASTQSYEYIQNVMQIRQHRLNAADGSAFLILAFLTAIFTAAGCSTAVKPDPQDLGMHIHLKIEIDILGTKYPLPADIGLSEIVQPIHTHSSDGVVHVESPTPQQFYLKDFFAVWGKRFDEQCIVDMCADPTHEVVVFVNGERSQLYGDMPLRDNDHIRIVYREKP